MAYQDQIVFEVQCRTKRHFGFFSPTYGFTAVPEAQYDSVFHKGLTMAQLHKQLNELLNLRTLKFLMLPPRRILLCTVCNFPNSFILSWSGATKVKAPCTEHRPCGNLAYQAANTGRPLRRLLGRSAI